MQKFIILHSNDIHSQIQGLARISTLVKQIRAENPDIPVLYFDAGDIEESAVRISNLTRGTGMHRLLSAAGCQAETIGNGGIMRYGFEVLANYGASVQHPLLLANVRWPDGSLPRGVQPTTILQVGKFKLGLIGITDNLFNTYDDVFLMQVLPTLPLVRELARQLRLAGADIVILLSHMGLRQDRELARALQTEIPLIIGAHSHDLLPDGERIGAVTIAQAGWQGEHLGRLDLCWNGAQLIVECVSIIPVSNEITPDPAIQTEIEAIEADIAPFLNEIVGELIEPLDFAVDRECRVANLAADAVRTRMQADVGLIVAANASTGPLPAGRLRRETLWEVCHSGTNPGITTMTGEQLTFVIARGQDRELAARGSRGLRCDERGLLHLSGASLRNGQIFVGEQPIELERLYRVAGSDWELEDYGQYIKKEWQLAIRYDIPNILCNAIETYLTERGPVIVSNDRLG